MLGRSIADVRKRATELRSELRSGSWTRDEMRQLKDLYGTRTEEDLEVALQRPQSEITAMASQLCLAKDKRFAAQHAKRQAPDEDGADGGAREMPRWTDSEVEKLRALYADRDNLAVARALGRTVASIANKANLLGLKKSAGTLARIGRANVGMRHSGGAMPPAR
jgi:hypothetical protein